jgi:hypothetical protein
MAAGIGLCGWGLAAFPWADWVPLEWRRGISAGVIVVGGGLAIWGICGVLLLAVAKTPEWCANKFVALGAAHGIRGGVIPPRTSARIERLRKAAVRIAREYGGEAAAARIEERHAYWFPDVLRAGREMNYFTKMAAEITAVGQAGPTP